MRSIVVGQRGGEVVTTPPAECPGDDDPTGRPLVVADLAAVLAGGSGPGSVWRLTDSEDLHANVIRLDAGGTIQAHRNQELDVLFVGIAGRGELRVDDQPVALQAGIVVLVPRGAVRSVVAADQPLAWLTVHRRRSGLRIAGPAR